MIGTRVGTLISKSEGKLWDIDIKNLTHVVFEKLVGKGCHFRQETVALRCCVGLGGPKFQFSSNSVDIQILVLKVQGN